MRKKIKRICYKTIGKIAIFDFDYTLAETSEYIYGFSYRKNGYVRISQEQYKNNKDLYYDMIDYNSFREFDKINLKKVNPIKVSIEFMQELYEKGYEIIILSSRPQKAEEDIDKFIKKYTKVKEYKFIGLNSGDKDDKYKYIERNCSKYSWFIEDNAETIGHVSMKLPFKINFGHVRKQKENYIIEIYQWR